MNKEVGRVLKASELKPRQIVILHKATKSFMTTHWVINITADFVEFYSGVSNMAFIAKRQGDAITDNTGEAFTIYEYLGKP